MEHAEEHNPCSFIGGERSLTTLFVEFASAVVVGEKWSFLPLSWCAIAGEGGGEGAVSSPSSWCSCCLSFHCS